MRYWIVKTEPQTYSFEQLAKDGDTVWDGVRNFQARNNLRDMAAGDLALVYHSGGEKAVVGVARVVEGPFPDPGDKAWVAVRFSYEEKLQRPVTLAMLKANAHCSQLSIVKHSRLSVHPLQEVDFKRIVALSSS